MSVLLDALKKAAEEKKNAENGIQKTTAEQVSPPESSEVDEISSEEAGFKLTLEEPAVNSAHSSSNVESASEETLIDEPELPVFNLQESDDSLNDTDSLSTEDTVGLKLEDPDDVAAKHSLEINDQAPQESTQDLTSLIDSLDLGEETPAENVRLDSKQEHTLENALSVEQQHQPDLAPLSMEPADVESDSSLASQPEAISTDKDDFQWSMDELPGYSGGVSSKKMDSTTPLEQNPILINGDNAPQKSSSKYATSSKVIVSLFVVLLFIGIGFYGMLYYQEQNEALERSMRQYNIAKIQIVPPKSASQENKQVVEENTEVLSLNVVKEQAEKTAQETKSDLTPKEQNAANNVEELTEDSSKEVDGDNLKSDSTSQNLAVQDNKKKSLKAPKAKVVSSKNTGAKKAKPTIRAEKSYRTAKPKKVSPSKVVVQVNKKPALMREAYAAYNSGKFGVAKQSFSKILVNDPENVTALLGLGGVAVASGKHYEAIGYYQRILDSEPNNLAAFESIANLSGRVPLNKEWENELFRMAENYPRSATLQYAKGNVYAKSKDWLSAQESYFNALVLDSTNPDYMVNLAVSYDHIGKYKLASQYYTQALAFANRKQVSFDQNQVRNRLISIRQFIVKGS